MKLGWPNLRKAPTSPQEQQPSPYFLPERQTQLADRILSMADGQRRRVFQETAALGILEMSESEASDFARRFLAGLTRACDQAMDVSTRTIAFQIVSEAVKVGSAKTAGEVAAALVQRLGTKQTSYSEGTESD